jgi:hypothetical protein
MFASRLCVNRPMIRVYRPDFTLAISTLQGVFYFTALRDGVAEN